MKEYKRGLTPVEKAVLCITDSLPMPDATENVSLLDGLKRVLAKPVRARVSQPPFTRSPLDGYALRASDIDGASRDNPVTLPVSQYLPAGSSQPAPLQAGTAARIMTGAPIPDGADCVIRQEDTDQGEEKAQFYQSLREGCNICYEGEDITAGNQIMQEGVRLTFAHVGILAGQGIEAVEVFNNPRIAVMSTGDELISSDQQLTYGKIYDSNSIMLAARMTEMGIKPDMYQACPDHPDILTDKLDELLKSYTFIITTGGVSVGKKDFMPEVIERLHMKMLFHGIDAKPGSPVMAAVRDGSVLLALSGNPFASLATFELLARAGLAKISGETHWSTVKVQAKLKGDFPKKSGIRRFLRGRIEGGFVSIPEKGHSSGGIGNLAGCNCLIDVPGGSGFLMEGDVVTVWLI